MTDAELLYYYTERERIIFGGDRSPGHYRLREFGYTEEHPANFRNLLITVTDAGRAVLESKRAA